MLMERPAFYRLPRRSHVNQDTPPEWRNSIGSNRNYFTLPRNFRMNSTRDSRKGNQVSYGSPAGYAGLQTGDVVLGINSTSTINPIIPQYQASDMIKRVNNTLQMTVQRNTANVFTPGSPPPPPHTPTAPISFKNMNMDMNMNMNTAPKNLPQSPLVKPQSKTHIPFNAGIIPHFEVNTSILPSEQEKILYEKEKEKERQAVVNQPHRTIPMVMPKPKPIHDYPVGSYLKYMKDPGWQQSPRVSSPVPRPEKLRQVMNKFGNNIPINSEKVVHLQYNSPINVYSNDTIAETLVPPNKRIGSPSESILSGRRSGTPLNNIRESPTWQFIQEQENIKVHAPSKEKIYSPGTTNHPVHYAGHFPAQHQHIQNPELPHHRVSTIDGHENTIQSTTFKHLMTSLLDHPSC
ncbi:uncharacterized protein LOC141855709 isoform X2 [Brevipalpus obovatus]|uniref:uncharacterized protein LOC141855709 isoform X2 n=1 Tax=Brevipalpus obovatus TaxID=246614 RepID=UPI003D9DD0AF